MHGERVHQSRWRGRVYAASVTTVGASVVWSAVGATATTVQLLGVLSAGVVIVGLYGLYDPSNLGFADESGSIVFVAFLAAVASLLFLL